MMRIRCIIVFILLITNKVKAKDTTNVLFIGNSITYFNNMPKTFEAISNSKGNYTKVTVYAPGGTGFIHHVNDLNVYKYFKQKNWDYVVLQPGSNESPGYSEPIYSTLERAKILKDSIQYYNPCSKIIYYEISYGVRGNTQSDLNNYNNTMDLIRANLEYLSDSTELFFAPAGESIRAAWNNDQTSMLWGSNGDIHPNDKGSYIIACTFYATIFQKPSFGTNVIGTLNLSDAINYQQLVDSIVLNNLSNWRINTYNQYTNFNFSINQFNVTFTSISQNIDSIKWDFGDGNTSNLPVISHNYNQAGIYNVILTTYKNGCVEKVSQIVNIKILEVENINSITKSSVYPNPFSEKIIIDNYTGEEILFFNLLGQNFSTFISLFRTLNGIEINTTKLPAGTYLLKTKTFTNIVHKN